jgi:hypothetical protein
MDTPNFTEIYFNESYKTFIKQPFGIRVPSVSSFLKEISPVFDEKAAAEAKAKKTGLEAEYYLKYWKLKAEEGRCRGNRVHHYLQSIELMDNPTDAYERGVFNYIFDSLVEGYKVVGVEVLVGIAGMAGFIDLLLYNERSQTYKIVDFKTDLGDLAEEKPYHISAPYKVFNIPSTKLNKYIIQVSLLKYMLERSSIKPGCTVLELDIVHVGYETKVYNVEAIDISKHYRKGTEFSVVLKQIYDKIN